MEVIYRKTEELVKLENNPRTITQEQLQKIEGVHTEQSELFRGAANYPFRPYGRACHYSRKPAL